MFLVPLLQIIAIARNFFSVPILRRLAASNNNNKIEAKGFTQHKEIVPFFDE